MLKYDGLDAQRKAAKRLKRDLNRGDGSALARVAAVLRDPAGASLMSCQHVIAVEAGFRSWADMLKRRRGL